MKIGILLCRFLSNTVISRKERGLEFKYIIIKRTEKQ